MQHMAWLLVAAIHTSRYTHNRVILSSRQDQEKKEDEKERHQKRQKIKEERETETKAVHACMILTASQSHQVRPSHWCGPSGEGGRN